MPELSFALVPHSALCILHAGGRARCDARLTPVCTFVAVIPEVVVATFHAVRPVGGHEPGAQAKEQAIPVIEERLVVGKRDVARGTVRVRVHVAEVPVEVPVHLREERTVVEHHPVDRPAAPADADAFREKGVEVEADPATPPPAGATHPCPLAPSRPAPHRVGRPSPQDAQDA